ncbi:hypothetical protein [Bacillus sp. NPDC094106]|uniref:hypothetical protein n=1 Tax=Bacillus sp. NPDC094106 TaxID=3363949 RepID=UPI0037F4EF0A
MIPLLIKKPVPRAPEGVVILQIALAFSTPLCIFSKISCSVYRLSSSLYSHSFSSGDMHKIEKALLFTKSLKPLGNKGTISFNPYSLPIKEIIFSCSIIVILPTSVYSNIMAYTHIFSLVYQDKKTK